jgi:hypothetical protein
MSLIRALSAEVLKIRKTLALKLVVLAPMAVVLLTLFMASQAPFSTLRRGTTIDVWRALARVNFQFWGLLMLPLYVALQTTLIAGLDHADNQWKALLARPVPRWTIYVAKLLVVIVMVIASVAILVGGVLIEGKALHRFDASFSAAVPVWIIARQAAEMTGLSFLFLAIQHWVSLRWRSFSVSIGFGIVAIVTSFAMLLTAGQYGGWPQYFPWSLPMLVLAHQPRNISLALWVGGILAIVIISVGSVEFCKREVA